MHIKEEITQEMGKAKPIVFKPCLKLSLRVLLPIRYWQCPFERLPSGFEIQGNMFFRNRAATGG